MKTKRPGLTDLLKRFWYVAALLLLGAVGLVIYIISQGMTVEQLLRHYGYAVIVGWTFLEGETIVIIAGMFSGTVGLDPKLIALCAFAGTFCSDQLMFSLGKYKGRSVLHYFPRIERNMDKAAGLFHKYDTALILGFRFIYGVRNVTPIMLGISGVSHRKFFFLNIIGGVVWSLTFTYGGVYSGQAFMSLMSNVGHGIFYVIIAVIVAVGLIWFLRSRRAVKHVKEVASHCHDVTHESAHQEPHEANCESADKAPGESNPEAAGPDPEAGKPEDRP